MDRPPTIAPALVNEFVLVAHKDVDRVKWLLAQEPKLVNACWDWGGGDFETALDMAAHASIRTTHLYERRGKAVKMDAAVPINLRKGKA
jgi:hypothetical protein